MDGWITIFFSLACSSLVGGITETAPPSPLIITHCMTPPQAYWIRYAQTELVEVLHNTSDDVIYCVFYSIVVTHSL